MKTKTLTAKDTGRALYLIRKRLGLNQLEVAGILGVSQGAVSKMENAKLEPSAIQWLEFCRRTQVPADVLWDLSEEEFVARAREAKKRRLLSA